MERRGLDHQQDETRSTLPDEEVLEMGEGDFRRYMSGRLSAILSTSSLVADTLRESYARDENTTNAIEIEFPDGRQVRLEKWPEYDHSVLQWNRHALTVESLLGGTGRVETHMFISPRFFMISEEKYSGLRTTVPTEANRYGSSAIPNMSCEPEGTKSEAEMKLLAVGLLRDLEEVLGGTSSAASQRCV